MQINLSESQTRDMKDYLIGKINYVKEKGLSCTVNIETSDIRSVLDLTIRDVTKYFGTNTQFAEWLKATKEIEKIHETRLKNAKEEKTLIARDIIKAGVIEPFDRAHNLLLSDGVKTITARLTLMINAGRTKDDCEKFVSKQISSHIRAGKSRALRTLEDLDR